jgi:hypothetical protein
MFNKGFCILRPNSGQIMDKNSPFVMLKHPKGIKNKKRFSMLSKAILNQYKDGLVNIDKLAKVVNVELFRAFTLITVQLLV